MNQNDPPRAEHGDGHGAPQTAARKPRGIRFSDSEWAEVKQAAETHDVPAAEFVRDTILKIARNPAGHAPVSIPTNLTPLIERTFRYTYMLATKMRDDMTVADQRDELNTLITEARELQDQLLDIDPQQ